MTKIMLLIFLCLGSIVVYAQSTDNMPTSGRELFESAEKYLQKGDYSNAIMVFNQAIQVEPRNFIYHRELAYAYYLQGEIVKAERVIGPLLKAQEADAETFLIACKVYTSLRNTEDAKISINKGIDKFPTSGILYEEKGQLYASQKKYQDALEAWEEGIKNAPSFYMNYYNAGKAHFFKKDYLWAIVYGETFVNMESFSSRTEEIKKIIFESYKFLIAELNIEATSNENKKRKMPRSFAEAFLSTLNEHKNIVTGGVNHENLAMLRIRFLLSWNKNYAKKYPLELIDYQQRLLTSGFYECYSEWLLGRSDNEKAMIAWTQKHAALMNKFDAYFRMNKLVPKKQQYYQK